MKKKKFVAKLTPILLIAVMLISLFGIGVNASETVSATGQKGLSAEIITDKTNYNENEDISVKVKITNGNNYSVNNVRSELTIPDKFSVKSGDLIYTKLLLESGESTENDTTVIKGEIVPVTENPNIPQTGEKVLLIISVVLLLLSSGGMIMYIAKNKKSKNFFAFLLCLVMILTAIPINAFASGGAREDFTVTKEINVGGEPVTLSANISCDAVKNVTVKFKTNGGTDVDSVTLEKGQKLSDLPISSKEGCAFIGWYTDKELTEQFYKDIPVSENITLYANFISRDDEFTEYKPTESYIKDQPNTLAIVVSSDNEITESNLNSYLSFKAITGELPEFSVKADGNKYTITPKTPYTPGGLYDLTLGNGVTLIAPEMEFSENSAVRVLSFRIHKDATEKVEYVDGIKTMDRALFLSVEDGSSIILKKDIGTLTVGDVLLISDKANTENCRYVKIAEIKEKDDQYCLISFIDCNVDDVYSDLDIYYEDVEVTNDELSKQIDTQALANSLYRSRGTKELTYMLAAALADSPTVTELGGGMPAFTAKDFDSFSDNAEITDSTGINISNLIEGLTISASVGAAKNSNFARSGIDEDGWTALSITFSYLVTLKNSVKIKAEINVTEYLHLTMQGYKQKDGIYIDFDYALNNYSQTDVSFTVLVCSANEKPDEGTDNPDTQNPGNEKYQDISVEITSLINNEKEQNNDSIISQMNEMLDSEGGYIDLCRVPFYKAIVPVANVFQVNIKVEFVVKINFAAGLKTQFTYLDSMQIGMYGSTRTGDIETYKHTLPGADRYSIDLYACGYIGLKAGVESEMSVSFIGLQDLGEIGIGFDLGFYIDIYGYLHYQIENNKWGPNDGSITRSLTGGIYMEMGVYIEINIFARSEAFKAEAETTIFELKIPLFSVGNQYILLGLIDDPNKDTDTLFIKGDSVPLKNLPAIYARCLDITSGEIVTQICDSSKLNLYFSSPYIKQANIDGVKTIVVDRSKFGLYGDGVKSTDLTFETTVKVLYDGQILLLNKPNHVNGSGNIVRSTIGNRNVIWVDGNADMSATDYGKSVKATFTIEADGKYYPVCTRDVLAGKTVGSVDLSAYENSFITRYRSAQQNFIDPYWDNDPSVTAITQDTEFIFHTKHKQKIVGYVYFNGKDWTGELRAVNIGEMPDISVFSDENAKLVGWSGEIFIKGDYANSDKFDGMQPVIGDNYYTTGYDTDKSITSMTSESKYEVVKFVRNEHAKTSSRYGTYYGNYDFAQYDVTYINNHGTFSEQVSYMNYPTQSEKYNYSVKSGYSFSGWDTNHDGVSDYAPGERLPAVTKSVTYEAVYSPKSYTITVFDFNGESKEYVVKYGQKLPDILYSNPALPTAGEGESYSDSYWKCHTSFADEYYNWNRNQEFTVWADMWFKPECSHFYDVVVNAGGGIIDGKEIFTDSARDGSTVSLGKYTALVKSPASDNYNNYVITGWKDDKGTFYNINDTIVADRPLKFTAVFETRAKVYKVTVSTDHGILLNGSTVDSFSGGYDQYLAFIEKYKNYVPEKVTEVDKIWSLSKVVVTPSADNMSSEIRLDWDYTLRQYTDTFVYNNGQPSSSSKQDYGSYFKLPQPAAYETDYCTYAFVGWDVNDDGAVDYKAGDEYTITGDVTFKAIWEQDVVKDYQFTFYSGGGSFLGDKTERIYTGHFGDKFTVTPEIPVAPANMEFIGWDNKVPDTFDGSHVFYAQYDYRAFDVTFKVTNNADNAVNDRYATFKLKYNSTITEDMLPKIPDEATGRLWSGWKTADGKDAVGTKITGTTSIVGTITPVFVSYVHDGITIKKTPVLIGDTITVDDNIAGYSSWHTDNVVVADGKFKMPSKDVVLYCETDLTGNFYISDGTAKDAYDATTHQGNDAVVSGYTFDKVNGVLNITGNGLTLSGSAKDIIIIVAKTVTDITLTDFTAISTTASDYVIPESVYPSIRFNENSNVMNDFLLVTLGKELTMNINGNVKLVKDIPEGENKSAICFSPIDQFTENPGDGSPVENYYDITNGTFLVNGGKDAVLTLSAGGSSILAFGDVSFNNVSLDVTTDYHGIEIRNVNKIGGNADFNNCSIKIAISADSQLKESFHGIISDYGITITDCVLDIGGTVRCTDSDISARAGKLLINGKTSGSIKNDYGDYAINADKVTFNLNKDYAVDLSSSYTAVTVHQEDGLVLENVKSSVEPYTWFVFDDRSYYYLSTSDIEDPTLYIKAVTYTGI